MIRLSALLYGTAGVLVALQPGLAAMIPLLIVAGASWVQALSGFAVGGQLWAPAGSRRADRSSGEQRHFWRDCAWQLAMGPFCRGLWRGCRTDGFESQRWRCRYCYGLVLPMPAHDGAQDGG